MARRLAREVLTILAIFVMASLALALFFPSKYDPYYWNALTYFLFMLLYLFVPAWLLTRLIRMAFPPRVNG